MTKIINFISQANKRRAETNRQLGRKKVAEKSEKLDEQKNKK